MRNEAFNFHKLFLHSSDKAFINRLEIDDITAREMGKAVELIKDALSPALRKLALELNVPPQYATPRFRFQGSTVYKTQNSPAHIPQQQVDSDLGVYIAAVFMSNASNGDTGKKYPARELAKRYFEVVDKLLSDLCKQQGWKYAEGHKQKDTCCRIDLSPKGVHAHIDVPLYATPNEQFAKVLALEEQLKKSVAFADARANIAPQIDEDGWDELTVIVMATRSGEWTESDVQIVIQHFKNAATRFEHPYVLRRIWRYVKAWRDYTWRDGKSPSSVLLMEAVVKILDMDIEKSKQLLGSGRDDRILHYVFSHLGTTLSGDVIVNWSSSQEDLNRGDKTQRAQWSLAAKTCHQHLDQALFEASLQFEQVISHVRIGFGHRIPNDIKLLVFLAGTANSAYASTPPKKQPPPQERIHRTTGA